MTPRSKSKSQSAAAPGADPAAGARSGPQPQGTQADPQGTQANPQGTQANPQGTQANPQGTQAEPQGTKKDSAARKSGSQAPDEQRQQAFLEEAAPVIFEARVIDPARCNRLRTLATRNGLTESQFREVLDGLAARGVVGLSFRWPVESEFPSADELAKGLAKGLGDGEPDSPDAAVSPEDSKQAASAEARRASENTTRLGKLLRERAATILAEHGGVSPKSRAAVLAEGERLGLRIAEIQRIVGPLFAAGAVATSSSSPGTPSAVNHRPPPLPSPAASSTPAEPADASQADADRNGDAPDAEIVFISDASEPVSDADKDAEPIFISDDDFVDEELPVPPPLPATRSGPAGAPGDRPGEAGAESAGTAPPSREDRRQRERSWFHAPPSANRTTIEAFLTRAAEILAEQRGFHAQSYALLMASAHNLGMNEAEFDEALRELRGSAEPPPRRDGAGSESGEGPPDPTADLPGGEAEGDVAAPPRANESPREAYRRYLIVAFGTRATLSERTEEKLIREGMRKLGLSHVYAQQILWEVAGERRIRVASQQAELERLEAEQAEWDDPLLQKFAAEAVPILAQHRGVNAKSRVLLEAVAQQLGLSPDQTERGLELLQRNALGEEDPFVQKREKAFRDYLSSVLGQLPRGVLTASIESTLAEVGIQLHGLTAEQTYPLIRDMAGRCNVRYVPHSQAVQHITGLVEERMVQGQAIVGDVRDRLVMEGDQWGLDSEQVDEIIRGLVQSADRQRSKERQITTVALALACLAVCLIVVLFAWMLVAGSAKSDPGDSRVERPEGDVPPVTETTAQPGAAVVPQRAKWWEDESLEIAYTLLRGSLEDPQKEVLWEITQPEDARRGRAYSALVGRAFQSLGDPIRRQGFQDVFVACYALETSDESASRIGEALVARLPREGQELSESSVRGLAPFTPVYWAVETVARMLKHPKLSDARAASLVQLVDGALRITTDRSQPFSAVRSQLARAVSTVLYGNVIAAVAEQPDATRTHFGALRKLAQPYLADEEHERLQQRYILELLKADSSAWRSFAWPIREIIDSDDPLTVLGMVEVFERSSDTGFQNYAGPLLLSRVSEPPQNLPVEEVASIVRKALGVTSPEDVSRRAREFAATARQALQDSQSPVADLEAILNDISRLVHYATMGVALGQQDLGVATYEQLAQDGPLPLRVHHAARGPASGPRRTPRNVQPAYVTRTFERSINMMSKSRNPMERAQLFVTLASMADHQPEIDAEWARELGKYLMASKSDSEHRMIMPFVERARVWPQLRLAVADELASMRSRDEHVEILVDAMAGVELDKSDFEQWREEAENQLFRGVLAEVAGQVDASDAAGTAVDNLRDLLLDRYRRQAQLLGLPPGEVATAETPGALLVLLIRHQAAAAGAADGAAEPELGRQLAAIEFVAENDLQYTALLQRLWLEQLAREAAAKGNEKAQEIYDELLESDQQSGHVLAQLRDGEAALLRYWMTAIEP